MDSHVQILLDAKNMIQGSQTESGIPAGAIGFSWPPWIHLMILLPQPPGYGAGPFWKEGLLTCCQTK